jgi:molecular chaperone IbpA
MAMRTFDFSPLYRSTVGFDSMTRLLESALHADEGQL